MSKKLIHYFLSLLFLSVVACAAPIFYLEGNMGAGKTTLLKELKKQCPDWVCVEEPIDRLTDVEGTGDVMQLFYDNPEVHLPSLLTRFYLCCHEAVMKAYKASPDKIIIIDRSPDSIYQVFGIMDLVMQTLSELNFMILTQLVNVLKPLQPTIAGSIFVRSTPEIAFQRVQQRGRAAEKTVTLKFVATEHVYCEKMLEKLPADTTLILDGTIDREVDREIIIKHVQAVKAYVERVLIV